MSHPTTEGVLICVGRFLRARSLARTLGLLILLFIVRGGLVSAASYYEVAGPYCNGACPSLFGDPIDLASGAFHIDQRLATIPGRLPIDVGWQFVSQDESNGPLGLGTSLSTDWFIEPILDPIIFELLGPKNVHFQFFNVGGTGDYINLSDPPMLGATLRFNVPRPSADLSGTLQFKSGDRYVFDSTGALIRIEDRHGNFLTITRNAQGYPTAVTQPTGRAVTFAYNAAGKLASVTLPLGRVWQFEYDAQGRLSSVTDPTGAATQYTWTTYNRPPTLPLVRSIRDRRGNTYVTNEYDSQGRVVTQTYADGGILTATYPDFPGSDGTTTITDPRGNVRRAEYAWTGGLFGYDVTREIDALGRVTSFERMGPNRLITGIVDFRDRRTSQTWDSRGNLLSVTRPTASGGTATWSATYDTTWSRVTSVTDPLGQTTQLEIDPVSGNLTAATNPRGNTMRFTYAANGDLVSLTTPAPLSETTTFTYTADGDLSTVTDPLGRVTEFTYDGASRLIAIRDANARTVQVAYDPLDRVTSLTQTLSGVPAVRTFAYDPEGNLQRLTDPNGNSWQRVYDAMNRLIEERNPLLQSVLYTWDRTGNLLTRTDALGQRAEYSYDALNRRTGATFRRPDSSVESTVTSTFNPTTQLLDSIADTQFGAYSWTYDSIDRIIGQTGPNGSLAFSLDDLGRRTGLEVGGAVPISYTHDANGNVTSIAQGPDTYAFTYDALDRLTERQLPNGVSTAWAFDAAGFVSSILSRLGDVTFDSRLYTRDAVGTITQENANGELRAYGYDDLYRLTSASLGAVNQAWTYDPAGNRLTGTVGGVTTTYTYDTDNRLTTVDGVPVTHDANGNLVADGSQTYTWDVRGRLAGVTAAGSSSQFTYDPFNLRTGKVVDGSATAYLLDGPHIVREISGVDSVQTVHGPTIDQPLSRGGLYFTPDHLGSTTTLTDATGSVVQRYAYSPFGDTTRSTTVANPFQFTGRENDETGLYYYRARHYAPKLGRFISQDPIGFEAGDTNLYSYVGSDPVNSIDPFGENGKQLKTFDLKAWQQKNARDLARDAEQAAKGSGRVVRDYQKTTEECEKAATESAKKMTPSQEKIAKDIADALKGK